MYLYLYTVLSATKHDIHETYLSYSLLVLTALTTDGQAKLTCRRHYTSPILACCVWQQTLISLQALAHNGETEVCPKYVRMFQVKYWPSADDDSCSVERHFSTFVDLLVHVDSWQQRRCCNAPICVMSRCVFLDPQPL